MIRHDQIEYAELTDVGVRRSHNQDNLEVIIAADEDNWKNRGHFFLVADGMGAHAVGEKASEQAVQLIPHLLFKYLQQGPVLALRRSFSEANDHIHHCGQANREFKGMGTTATGLFLSPEGAWVGHVGDSRCYRIRGNQIEQLSYDHSLLWEFAHTKGIDPDEVTDIPSNVIYRCLGPEANVKVDVEGPYPLQENDIFLLCSDGLTGQVSDVELGVVLTSLNPSDACRFLIDLANLRGGPDNITAIIAKITSSGTPASLIEPENRFPSSLLWKLLPSWYLGSLACGTLLALVAAYISWFNFDNHGTYLKFLLLGAVGVFAGLCGLAYQSWVQVEPVESEETSSPRIHRRRSFKLEPQFLNRLSRDLDNLKKLAETRNASVKWESFESHRANAHRLFDGGQLPDSFREFCLSMIEIGQAIRHLRTKEETFMPRWDK